MGRGVFSLFPSLFYTPNILIDYNLQAFVRLSIFFLLIFTLNADLRFGVPKVFSRQGFLHPTTVRIHLNRQV